MIPELRHTLEQRAAIACRMAWRRGEALENPYLPGSEQHAGWEQEKHRIEIEQQQEAA